MEGNKSLLDTADLTSGPARSSRYLSRWHAPAARVETILRLSWQESLVTVASEPAKKRR